MKKYLFFSVFFFCCSFCFVWNTDLKVFAEEGSEPLSVTVLSDKFDYSSQEKIKLDVIIKNNSDRDYSICTFFMKQRLLEHIKLEDEKGVVYVLRDRTRYRIPALTKDDYKVLEAGQEHEVKIEFEPAFPYEYNWYYKIPYTQEKRSFLPPGRYKLTVGFENKGGDYEGEPKIWVGNITSNEIMIEIIETALITRERAFEIAQGACVESGWDFYDPLITDKGEYWEVVTDREGLKENGYICIDKRTGSILTKYRINSQGPSND